jgi:hypothetical protein
MSDPTGGMSANDLAVMAATLSVDEAGNSVCAQKAIAYVAERLQASVHASRPR